jgi:hypothetical protein
MLIYIEAYKLQNDMQPDGIKFEGFKMIFLIEPTVALLPILFFSAINISFS